MSIVEDCVAYNWHLDADIIFVFSFALLSRHHVHCFHQIAFNLHQIGCAVAHGTCTCRRACCIGWRIMRMMWRAMRWNGIFIHERVIDRWMVRTVIVMAVRVKMCVMAVADRVIEPRRKASPRNDAANGTRFMFSRGRTSGQVADVDERQEQKIAECGSSHHCEKVSEQRSGIS